MKKSPSSSRTSGFTLLELVVTVAIIGILAAVAVPHFGDTIRTSNEGSTRGNLGSIRKALGVYFTDLDGVYPASLSELATNARYLKRIPVARITPYHENSSAILDGTAPDDAGGWVYNNTAGNQNYGAVLINCTHTDSHSAVWSAF